MTRREMYDAGMTDREIAEREGLDRAWIGQWRRKNGLPTKHAHRGGRKPKGHMDVRRARYDAGLSDREIADLEGVGIRTIAHWRENNRLPLVKRSRGSERGDTVIVSLDQLRGVFDLHRSTPDSSWSGWLERMGATVW